MSNFASGSPSNLKRSEDLKLWHERLGHPSNKVMTKFLEKYSATSSDVNKEMFDCEPCRLSKATRVVQRNPSSSTASRPFYRVYIDLFSLPTSYNHKKTALLIKDEFTKIIFVYALPNSTASDIINCLKFFQNYIKTQFSLIICVIHRDNDVALQNKYQNFIEKMGI